MLMNFSDYKIWQKAVLETQTPVRLDCLNPFIAMRWSQKEGQGASGDPVSMLQSLLGYADSQASVSAVSGVRTALEDIFGEAKRKGWTLALPEDVYPFYWEAADRAGYTRSAVISFPTLPGPDFTPLNQASGPTVCVLTAPLSPLGRHLTTQEVAALEQWLAKDQARMLVLDSVYAYQAPLHASLRRLWESGQTIILNSLSKTHLQRGLFGLALCPAHSKLSPQFRAPTVEGVQAAVDALTHHRHHARDQQTAFDAEWRRLTPLIESMTGQAFTPPENGYLVPVPISVERALAEHNVLLVPASVFGSALADLSIATCLHDISLYQTSVV